MLSLAPLLMKTLSVVGTAAMFLVGGGILMHGLPVSPELTQVLAESVQAIPLAGAVASALMPTVVNAIVGILAGSIFVFLASIGRSVLVKLKANP